MAAVNRRSNALGPDFGRFLAAAAASNLGDGIRLGALPLLALSLTDDARLIGLVTAATVAPWLLGPLGGALVDRHDRRRLMIAGQLARAVLVAGLVAGVVTETATIWWAIVVALGLGAGEVVVDSASQAAIPQLVERDQLDRANGRLITAITVLDQVIGVALGAALFSVATSLPFAIDAATFVVGAALLATIRRPLQGTRTASTTVRADIAEGMRFLLGHRLLREMMVGVSISNLAGNVSFAVLVVLVVEELGASEGAFGLVLGAGAIGGVAGSLVAARLTVRFGRRRMLVALPAVLVVTHLVNATAPAAWVVSVSLFVSSFAIVCFNVPAQTIRQAVTPESLLGRVVGSWRMVGLGAAPLGAVLGGVVTEAANVRVANVVAAGFEAIAGLVLVAALRHLGTSLTDEATDAPPAAADP
ncbi:MAG: MFS transporter [Actinomycetota bacterium]|nr:MFS transporter [Actinomycetota bacterium]